jgi:MscS family membrane protein
VILLDELRGIAVRFPLVLAALALAAWLFGTLLARALKRWGARRGSTVASELERTAAQSLRLLVLLLGLDWALPLAPLPHHLDATLSGAIYVVTVLMAARLAIRLAALLMSGYLNRAADAPTRERAQREYLPLASTLSTVAFSMIAVILIAHHFGHDVSSLVAALGIGSLAIGLAAQQTLGNMIAGFTLLVDRPFRPGDRIRLASSETGEVAEIGIRSTRILLDDRNLLIVPNSELVNSRVVNFSFPSTAMRGEVRLRVRWGHVERAVAVAAELARAQDEVLADPPPVAVVAAFVDDRAEIVLRFHVDDYHVRAAVEDRLRLLLAGRVEPPPAGIAPPTG